MSLFQNAVLNKYLKGLDVEKTEEAYQKFAAHFHDPGIQQNIRNSKEEQYQGEFLIDLFVNVLGYVKNPTPNFNLTTELKNTKDSKKADGAILNGEKALAVIELKGTATTDLGKVEPQAFGYKNNQPGCNYVLISNFEKLRFYIDNAVDFEEFNLFQLSRERFGLLWLCLSADCLLRDIPKKIKDESLTQEENVTKKLYKDYAAFRNAVFDNIQKENPEHDKLTLFKETQKLLDRFLFIFFAEDRLLLPPNSIRSIVDQWTDLRDKYDEYFPLYDRFKKYFGYMNTGHKGKQHDIFAYNGGLFAPDEILDNIKIDDQVLHKHALKLSTYNFESEVSVNILGHIFEHSLNDIDEIQAEIQSPPGLPQGEVSVSKTTKRKKDGVFYTPKYITKYIVDNTVGKLCEEKKTELDIQETDYEKERKGRQKATLKSLAQKLEDYRKWLLQITICDPACGSGAFLNQALEFLIAEHRYIDELQAKLFGDAMVLNEVENAILENNLFGVDINRESVEIAKLSLWLRTAQKGRKLTALNNNIKCGNSLIDDPKVAGEKAFDWKKEFPGVFDKGGFDVVIGNPPYLRIQGLKDAYPELTRFYEQNFASATGNYDIYVLFMEKSTELIKNDGLVSLILPHKFLISEFGEGIRTFLAENRLLKSILHFEEHLVFEVTTYTCILTLDKKQKNHLDFKYINPKEIIEPFRWENIRYKRLGVDKWNLMSEQKISLFDKLKTQPFTAKDVFSKIFQGIATSADKVYLIDGKINGDLVKGYSQSLDEEVEIEKGLMKPLLKGQDVSRYKALENQYYVIFPYLINEKGVAVEMTENYIQTHFPKGYDYLKRNEKTLRDREKGRMDKEGWFLYIYPKSLTEFEQVKIITPEIANYPNMTFDSGEMYHNTKCYSFILKNPSNEAYKYYLAILNSKLLWFYLSNTGYVLRGGYFTFKTKYLYPFPLPELSSDTKPFLEKADQMLSLNKEHQQVETAFLALLQSKFPIKKPSKKLQNWHELDFAGFLKELKKQKVSLSLHEEAEWMAYFNAQKQKAGELKTQIDQTDNAIDQLVYELYGLTGEEIAVVESA